MQANLSIALPLPAGVLSDAALVPPAAPAPRERSTRQQRERSPVNWQWLPLKRLAWWTAPWLLPLALFALWSLGAEQGWISQQVLPAPAQVWQTLSELAASGDLWLHVWASLQRVLVGFAIGALLGLLLGSAMGLSRTVEAYLLPTFNALVQIPVLGWLPFVLLLWALVSRSSTSSSPRLRWCQWRSIPCRASGKRPSRCARWARSMASRHVSRCWRLCCRMPSQPCSPVCDWASPRPGCHWWWWNWWRRAKVWAF